MVFKRGHKVPLKWRKIMRDSNLGKIYSKETKEKLRKAMLGKNNHRWRGGRHLNNKGYIIIYSENHPCKIKGNHVLEHRLVMEKHIGRTLLSTEVVHHINNNKTDNRIENLMLFSDDNKHKKYHKKIRRL